MGKIPLMGRYHKLPRKLQNEYTVSSQVLGTGCNGSVRLATSRTLKNAQSFAVKSLSIKGIKPEHLSHLQSEIEIFLCMDHPHVARLIDVYESEKEISLVMERMAGGELFQRITDCKRFTERKAAEAMRQMLLAVNYIHSHYIVHRDLKLENFLLDAPGSDHLKLIDFGFSKFFDDPVNGTYATGSASASDEQPRIKRKAHFHTSCGTLAYVAPEVLKRSYSNQCDLWSMGVIVFILLSGHMPFHGDEDKQMSKIVHGRYVMKSDHWRGISGLAKAFVKCLLHVDPEKRLTCQGALEHRWIVNCCNLQGRVSDPISPPAWVSDSLRAWIVAPRLHRACMSMMAWSLSNEQCAQVRDHFLHLDKDHDGAISLSELMSFMVDRHHVPEAEVKSIFELFVKNHDQEIHYSDFLAAVVANRIELDHDLLYTTFQKFDVKSSGYITQDDLRDVLGETFEDEHVAELLQEADVLQKDGKIDFREFVAYIRASRRHVQCTTEGKGEYGDKSEYPTLLTSKSFRTSEKMWNDDGPALRIELHEENPPQCSCILQ